MSTIEVNGDIFTCVCVHVCVLSHACWMRLCMQGNTEVMCYSKTKMFQSSQSCCVVFFASVPWLIADLGTSQKKKIQFVLQQRQNKFCLWEDRGLRGKEKWGLLSEGDDGDKKEEKLRRGKIKTRKNTRERWQKYVLEEQKHIKETYTPITGRLPVTKLPGNRRSVYLWWWGEKVEEGEEEKRRAIGRCVTGR